MEKLRKIREMVCEELDNIAKKGELSPGSLETLDKLTHTLKSIDTVLAMNDYTDGASYDGPNNANMGGVSGARGRNARRDSMGRYSRDGGRRWRDDYRVSYDGARDELSAHVEELMDMAKDEPTRKMIERFKRELETA